MCLPSPSSIFSQISYSFGAGIYQALIILAHAKIGFECKIAIAKVSACNRRLRSHLYDKAHWSNLNYVFALLEGLKTLEADAVQKGLSAVEGRKTYNRFVLKLRFYSEQRQLK